MILFNYLIAALLASVPLSTEEKGNDGWFPVEHSITQAEDIEETDPSIWVLFSKQFENEKVVVRLPGDPAYRYAPGLFEATSSKGEEIFQIQVHEKGEISRKMEEILSLPGAAMISLDRKSETHIDLLYLQNEKWIQERLIETRFSLFVLQTAGPEPDSANHLHFINSLRIENSSR